MEMLYKYREAFSLRDEIGTCPNIEVEIEVTDKSPFSAYSSPVMLISRKLTKDKRVVTDCRHLNMRIAKDNLAYPLIKDTFSVLCNLKTSYDVHRFSAMHSYCEMCISMWCCSWVVFLWSQVFHFYGPWRSTLGPAIC